MGLKKDFSIKNIFEKDKETVFFDLEMDKYHLLQIGAIKVKNDEVIDKISMSCFNRKKLTTFIKYFLGINDQSHLKESDWEIYEEFHRFCLSSDYIVNFGNWDDHFIKLLRYKNSHKISNITNKKLEFIDIDEDVLWKKYRVRISLDGWSNIFTAENNQTHDALFDSYKLYNVTKKFIENESLDLTEKIFLESTRPRRTINNIKEFPELKLDQIKQNDLENIKKITFINYKSSTNHLSPDHDNDESNTIDREKTIKINIIDVNLNGEITKNIKEEFVLMGENIYNEEREIKSIIISENVLDDLEHTLIISDHFNKDIAQAYFTENKDLFLFHRINLIKLRAYFKWANKEDVSLEDEESIKRFIDWSLIIVNEFIKKT